MPPLPSLGEGRGGMEGRGDPGHGLMIGLGQGINIGLLEGGAGWTGGGGGSSWSEGLAPKMLHLKKA